MLSKKEVLRRWQTEPLYLDEGPRRTWMASIIESYAPDRTTEILELGCNAGSNLLFLEHMGYTQLAGCDINNKALTEMILRLDCVCPYRYGLTEIIDEVLGDGAFDIVFSMAVLMHIHPEDRFIFKRLHEITKKYLICAEWTKGSNGYIMPIDPKDFEGFDLIRCEPIEGLPDLVGYSLYVFKKKEH